MGRSRYSVLDFCTTILPVWLWWKNWNHPKRLQVTPLSTCFPSQGLHPCKSSHKRMQAFFSHKKPVQLGRWWHFSLSSSFLVSPGQWHASSSHIMDFSHNEWPFLSQTFSLIWWNAGVLTSQSFLICIIGLNKCAVLPSFLLVRYVVSSAQVYREHASLEF